MPKVGQPTAPKPAPLMALLAPRIEEERSESIAINLEDLDRMTDAMRQRLITGRVDAVKWIRLGEMEAAVQFTCDLLTAATVCDIVRSHDREVGDEPTRVYIRRGVAWNRLPALAVLTTVEPSGAVILHPTIFPSRPRAEAVAAARPRPVHFGVV